MGIRRFIFFSAAVIVLFIAGLQGDVFGQNGGGGVPVVAGKLRGDFARITFSWPERVRFKASGSGNLVTVTFDEKVNSSMEPMVQALSPYITKAYVDGDGRSVIIQTDKPYNIRTFMSGSTSGVDILKVRKLEAESEQLEDVIKQAEEKPESAPEPAQESTTKETPKPVEKPAVSAASPATPVAKPTPPVKAATKQATGLPNEAVPQAKPTSPKAVATKEEKPVATPVDKPAPPKAEKETAEAEKQEEKKPEPPKEAEAEKKPEPKEEAKTDVAEETPKAEEKPQQEEVKKPETKEEKEARAKKAIENLISKTTAKKGEMTVAVHRQKIASQYFFPWRERVSVAVFVRGSYLWVVFDKHAKINLESLNSILPPYIASVESLDVPDHTVLRFKTNAPLYASVKKKRDSYEWIIDVSRRSRIPVAPIPTETRTEPPLKPHVFIPLLQTSKVVEVVDPVMGDTLSIIPTYGEGKGLFPPRHFVDFSLLRTSQGVVVKKHAANVRIAKLRNGLRITRPGSGITLTEKLPALDLDQFVQSEENAHTFFPYSKWKSEDSTAFLNRKFQLQNEIVHANDEKANFLRMELAQLYMGAGYHYEALGVLNQIKRADQEFFENYQLAAMRGAANFMVDRIAEANTDFNDGSLEGEDEIDYWRRATAVMLGQENKLIKFLNYDQQFGKHYPPEMRQKLAVIAADQLLGRGKHNTVFKIFDMLAADEQYESIKDQADYMVGRILGEMGKQQDGIEKLSALIGETNDRFVKVRAEFALATMQYETGSITRKELIEKLDRLRMIWRGDALELGILNLLGQLQVLEQNYIEGLRAWKEILTNYPGTAQSSDIATKMAEAFVQLFNEGKADVLPPLEALALYYEFRELTPIGDAGDRMIQNLADRLASVDLLDRAAALLNHQVKYRLEGEERSRVGARLALIHLLNREPRKSLEVLQLTGYGSNGEMLQRHRQHLAAMAYSDIGDWETALGILKDDYSDDAKMLRLDVFWENKDWDNVITTAEDMLASRKDITAPLDEQEAQALLRLAVAYTFEDDTLQLQYLRDYFSPLMEASPLKESFMFITNDRGPIDRNNIAMLPQDISQIKYFLENYRMQVQQGKLSSIN